MKNSPSRSWNVGVLTAIATFLVLPAVASAADFVLAAPHWGKKQDAAVAAAGGTVNWSHQATGIASVSSDNADFLAAVDASKAFTGAAEDMIVQWQEPNPVDQGHITPGDEWFFPLQWNMMAMEAPAAWAADCTGAGVRVAINDGGIDPTHPDLAPNMDASCSASFVPGFPFNSDTGGFWHGMHVAGIVGAADNGMGVIGVAPEAEMISVKVLHDGSGAFSWIIGGILYAADPAAFGRPQCEKADIINMSLGAGFNKRFVGGRGGSLVAFVNRAVNFAASKGTLVVSAAGNNGIDLGQAQDITFVPAESGSGIAIAATGPVDLAGVFGPPGDLRSPASYSNFGEGTTYVAAPGGQPGITAVVTVNSPGSIAGNKFAATANYGPPPAGETADVALWTDPVDTTGNPHDGCEGGIDASVAGKIALIHRGSCFFVTKSLAAEASGAVGVIISNNRPGPAPGLGGSAPLTIPSVGLGQSDGADIEGALAGGPVNVSLSTNPAGVLDQVASTCFSGWCFAFGTSMASPAAAGVAALILGQNPGMPLGMLKSRLAQTADDEGKIGNDEFYGHGFVNAANACGVN
jgi:subtilisin family serine protease